MKKIIYCNLLLDVENTPYSIEQTASDNYEIVYSDSLERVENSNMHDSLESAYEEIDKLQNHDNTLNLKAGIYDNFGNYKDTTSLRQLLNDDKWIYDYAYILQYQNQNKYRGSRGLCTIQDPNLKIFSTYKYAKEQGTYRSPVPGQYTPIKIRFEHNKIIPE